jgi:adenylate cyclase
MAAQPDRRSSPEWERILERGDNFKHLRRLFSLLPSDPRCELCRAPFSGLGGGLLRTVKGIRPSTLNPRFCNDCELLSVEHPGGAEVDVALLFADIRGSTTLAETMPPVAFSAVIDRFYRTATEVLIDAGALIEKLVGDEVTAIFAPGFAGRDYVRRAIDTGERLLATDGRYVGARADGRRAGARADGRRAGARADERDIVAHAHVPIGVGVHAGRAFVGAIGQRGRMITISALGDTVNIAARLASLAGPGEMLVSEEACRAAGIGDRPYPTRELALKGRRAPVTVRVVTTAALD